MFTLNTRLTLKQGVSALLLSVLSSYALSATTSTALIKSSIGGGYSKKVVAILGDGFQAGDDQTVFNDYVQERIMQGAFAEGPLMESLNAFDIYRVNTESVSSGVTQVNSSGTVTVSKNTALDYRYSGVWSRCWMEKGPNTNTNTSDILDDMNITPDYVIVVLNEDSGGGCRRGNEIAVTLGSGWSTVAHELGHMVGALCDEYVASNPTTYTGGEPGCVNLTINTNRNTLKWNEFIAPATPVPTVYNAGTMDTTQTVGAFEGGTTGAGNTFDEGIWRPSNTSRMNNNWPAYNPVGYKRVKEVLDPHHEHTFRDSHVGDFNGDGHDDVVIHNGNQIALYLANGNNLATTTVHTDKITGATSWQIRRHDQLFIGDFDGDGKDDIYIFNQSSDWSYPYLAMLRSTGTGFEAVRRYVNYLPGNSAFYMKNHDQFFVADFNNDGKDDLYLANTQDHASRYLTMLRSTGTSLAFVTRYENTLPGWTMQVNDQFMVADINGDQQDDLYVFNGTNWSMPYLLMLKSNATSLGYLKRYDQTLPGWTMAAHDKYFVADFNGDDKDDLYVFNGNDWANPYLKKLVSASSSLLSGQKWYDALPGWDMTSGDKFYVADINGDNQDDLYVYNYSNWDSQYLGTLISNGNTELTGSWQKDWVGSWNLGSGDDFLVGDFNGAAGWDDLFVLNNDWFGLLRSNANAVSQVAIHYKWIYDTLYHKWGWW